MTAHLDRARWPVAVTATATVIALVAGLFDLGRRSLWYDEAFTVGIVDRPLGDVLWRITHWEVNQSPYFVLFTGWFRLGHSEAFLRLLSVAFVVAAVPAMFVLGRRIADARVGALAAVLLAVHPLVIQWGQQLRAYSMVTFGVILATILLLRAVDRPDSTARALCYGVVAAATIYTQFFALPVIVAHLSWVALRKPMPRRVVVAAGGAIAVLVVPLVGYLMTYRGDPLAWVGGGSNALVATARGLTGGRTSNLAVYAVGALLGLGLVCQGLRRGDRRAEPSWSLALPVLWLVVPVLATLVVSATVKPLLEARFLIVVVPALVLVVAYGVCRLRWRPVAAVLAAALVVVSLNGLRSWYQAPMFEDWRAAVPVAIGQAGPDGVVLVDPHLGLFAVRYYEGAGTRARLFDPDTDGGAPPPRLVELSRVDQAPEDRGPLYQLWRDTHYTEVDTRHFAGLTVTTFEARP